MAAPSQPSTNRSVIIVVVALALIVASLVTADRLGNSFAEGRVANQFQATFGTEQPPEVAIGGIPFLTQVASENFKQVRIRATGVGATDERTLPVDRLALQLNDVAASDWYKTFVAAQVTGTALVGYPELQDLAGVPLGYEGSEGRIRVETQTKILGISVKATVTGRLDLNVTDQTLVVADPQITVAGVEVPDHTSQALVNTIVKPFPVIGVPFGLSLSAINAGPDGVDVSLAGENITVTTP